jgi:effector-binding domain-containing protein
MSILMKVVVTLVVLVAVLAGVGMMLPRQVHVERQLTIDAPRATVYALVDGYSQFNKWSPWLEKDPNAKYSIEGPKYGVGAKQSWSGNAKVGTGSQEITDVKPYERVTWKLVFADQPDPATGYMNFAPATTGTQVTWGLDCDMGKGPVGRYFGLLMDKMVGPDFEAGLAKLKTLAESMPKTDFATLEVTRFDAKARTVAYVEATASTDEKEIASVIGASYAKVGAFMKQHGLKIADAPQTINTRWDDAGYGFDAAIPVDKAPDKEIPADSPVQVKQTYEGPALKVVMKGPYSGMKTVYEQLDAYMQVRGYERAGSPWDEYVTDPGTTPETELTTNIIQPIK